MARYMGLMAKSGNVCTLIMMVIKAMYSRTLIKPEEERKVAACHRAGRHTAGCWCGSGEAQDPVTCKQLRVEHVHGLVVPGILTLEVHGVQHILDEDGEHHGHQNGILKAKHQLHRRPSGQDAVISVADKEEVQDAQEEHKSCGDPRGSEVK